MDGCVFASEFPVKLFGKFGIFTKTELESREEVIYETYAKSINIEALTMIDMAAKQIIPACMRYEKDLADTIIAVKNAGAKFGAEAEKLQKIADMIDDAQVALDALRTLVDQGGKMTNARERAFFFKDQIKPAMMRLRRPCDALEQIVDKSCWPFPTYEDMLFEL